MSRQYYEVNQVITVTGNLKDTPICTPMPSTTKLYEGGWCLKFRSVVLYVPGGNPSALARMPRNLAAVTSSVIHHKTKQNGETVTTKAPLCQFVLRIDPAGHYFYENLCTEWFDVNYPTQTFEFSLIDIATGEEYKENMVASAYFLIKQCRC